MPKKYSRDIHCQAKIMWLSGNYKNDKEIADKLGISRVETIKDWRLKENWRKERELLEREAGRQLNSVLAQSIAEMQRRHL